MRYELIPFHEHQISAVERDGTVYVIMKPIVEALELDWWGQLKRMKAHPVLSEGISLTEIPSGGGAQQMIILDLERFHGWLVTIDVARVPDARKRDAIIRYQREAFRAIYEHFHGPLRAQSGRQPPVREMLALQKETDRLVAALRKEADPVVRSLIHGNLCRTLARLGATAPALDDFDAAARGLARTTARDFFSALNTLDAMGIDWNLHRKPATHIAFNPARLQALFDRHGIDITIDRSLTEALQLSLSPRFLHYQPYFTALNVTARCYVFEKESEHVA